LLSNISIFLETSDI